MALDYSMMRDAVGMDVMNRLSRAQGIGEAAGTLGFLGADAFREHGGLGGLLNMFKGRQNPFTKESIENPNIEYGESIEDPNRQFGDYGNVLPKDVPMNERVSFEDPNRVYEQPNYEGYSEELPDISEEVITDSTTMPAGSTGFNLDDATKNWNPAFGNTALNDTTKKALGSGFQLTADNLRNYALNEYGGSGVIDPQRGGPMVGAPQDNYVVKPGDTSFDIKNKYGMTMQDLADQNFGGDLEAAKSIYPGDTLKVNPINTALNNEGSPSLSTGAGSEVNNQQGPEVNNQQSPLMGLINKGKSALGLNKDEYGRNYWDKLNNYIFHDQIAPWDPYHKDPYYDLEFDENDRLISDTKYGGLTKDQLNLDYPTYGWTTDARLGRSPSFFSDEIQDFRQGN